MNKSIISIAALVSLLFINETIIPCTALCLQGDGHIYVAKNYDWSVSSGLLIVNKASVAKTALISGNPANWVSKYGSVTFNQYGRENPNGGMNEAGLVVEILWLRATEYPRPDNRPSIGNTQWVQYQLDRCRTVEEVIATDKEIRINGDNNALVHYFVVDATGNTAVIEILNGKMVAHSGMDMPIEVITNNTYAESYEFAGKYDCFGGDKKLGERKTEIEVFSREASLDRFVHAGVKADKFKPENANKDIKYAFDVLALVKSGKRTVWNIVYDIPNRTIHFKSIERPNHKYLEFSSLEFDCNSPVFVIDINNIHSGDIAGYMQDYSYELNYNFLEQAIKNTGFLGDFPEEDIRYIARYPRTLKCME